LLEVLVDFEFFPINQSIIKQAIYLGTIVGPKRILGKNNLNEKYSKHKKDT
jgi:hypothetical protein